MRRWPLSFFEIGMAVVLAAWLFSIAFALIESSRFGRAEEGAGRLLLALRDAEESVRSRRAIDRDGDGAGEYAFVADLRKLSPADPAIAGLRPVGAASYQTEDESYLVTAYLPDEFGRGCSEEDRGRVSAKEAALCFMLYAWPTSYARTALRAFCLTAGGPLLVTENAVRQYSGRRRRPKPQAALSFRQERPCGATPNSNEKGMDRQPWYPAVR